MIKSLLQYGIIAWGGCSTTLKYNLSVAQKNIIKIIWSKPKTFPSKELLKLLRVVPYWTLKNYTKTKRCVLFTKLKYLKSKTILIIIEKNISKFLLITPKKASNIFNQVGLRTLETIPDEIRECSNNFQFKYKLKNWFYDSL